ncbi:MAG: methyltransferase family protein [Streptosporangiaceae bacterium]
MLRTARRQFVRSRRLRMRRAVIARMASGVGVGLAAAGVLRRMRDDFAQRGALRASTSVLVYATYVVHGLAMLQSLRTPAVRSHAPGRVVPSTGAFIAASGCAFVLSGAGAFSTTAQVSGTETGGLVTSGVYRWTRNPQYLGYLLVCGGSAAARRSADAGALTVLAATTFAYWIRCEEASLTRVFGNEYTEYAVTVPRWLGPSCDQIASPPHGHRSQSRSGARLADRPKIRGYSQDAGTGSATAAGRAWRGRPCG